MNSFTKNVGKTFNYVKGTSIYLVEELSISMGFTPLFQESVL